MKVIKRGNIAILSLALMVMIAGYINYRYDPEREKNLGQTVLVNSDSSYVYEGENSDVRIYEDAASRNETLYKNKSINTTATVKENRENMYSELEEIYKGLIESSNTSQENVKIYQDKLDNIIKEKHKLNLVESLIKTKGIENIVVTKTDDKINIVVSTKNKLTDSQVAIIQKIIQDEFKIETKDITVHQE